MRKLILAFGALVTLSAISTDGSVHHARAGCLALLGVGAACGGSAATAYQGPGDIVAGAKAWYGWRCYTATYSGNVARVKSAGDASTATITCSAGNLVLGTAGTVCATSCTVDILYDQSGAGSCNGSACDASQATEANRPTVTLNCQNGRPCMTCVGATPTKMGTSAFTGHAVAQPLTISAAAKRTGSGLNNILGIGGGSIENGFFNPNSFMMRAGSVAQVTASDNALHSLQGVYNNTSSLAYVDGTSTSVSPGTGSIAATDNVGLCALSGGADPLTGVWLEAGVWAVGFSPTDAANMTTNQRSSGSGWNF